MNYYIKPRCNLQLIRDSSTTYAIDSIQIILFINDVMNSRCNLVTYAIDSIQIILLINDIMNSQFDP